VHGVDVKRENFPKLNNCHTDVLPAMNHKHNHDNARSSVSQLVPVRFAITHPTAITVCFAKSFNKRGFFIENCKQLGLNPEKSAAFNWLEADERASFNCKPA
jgi:hypothetical protein